MAFDLVVRYGTAVKGTGGPGFKANVAVEGEKIVALERALGPGKKEMDAKKVKRHPQGFRRWLWTATLSWKKGNAETFFLGNIARRELCVPGI